MDEKKDDFYFNYSINWQQKYPYWNDFVDSLLEAMLESTNMKDAKKIIADVKSNLKGN